jgi:cell division septum initiation protein DivIVA
LDYLQKLITGAGSSNNSDLLAQMEDLKVENQKLKERVAELENSLAAATNAESPNTFAAGQTQESPTSETGNPSDAPASANQDS